MCAHDDGTFSVSMRLTRGELNRITQGSVLITGLATLPDDDAAPIDVFVGSLLVAYFDPKHNSPSEVANRIGRFAVDNEIIQGSYLMVELDWNARRLLYDDQIATFSPSTAAAMILGPYWARLRDYILVYAEDVADQVAAMRRRYPGIPAQLEEKRQ
jgi:hypothetical protein